MINFKKELLKKHNPGSRCTQEQKTLITMLRIYCRAHHGKSTELCKVCQHLQEYAFTRLTHCPHGERKPACSHCYIHCFKPVMREQIRQVMRYAGPRLLWHNPLLALRHIILIVQ